MCYHNPIIVCAALKLTTGVIVCGPRHYDVIMNMQLQAMGVSPIGSVQGFIDQYGRFYTREEAYIIAKENGQLKHPNLSNYDKLFPEDLY